MSNLQIGRKKYYLRAVVCLLILFVVSCNEKNAPENPENILKEETMQEELTIELAKQWFEKKVAPNANGRIAANAKKEVLWNYAIQGTEQGKDNVIIVPVAVEEKYQSFGVVMKAEDAPKKNKALEEKNYRENNYATPQKLVMFKDKKGVVQTFLMKVVADIEYFENSLKKDKKQKAKNDSKDFDGMLLFYDWDESKMIEGLRFEKGKVAQVFSTEAIKKNAKIGWCTTYEYNESVPCNNARTSSHSCYITYSITDCGYSGGSSITLTSMPSISGGGGSFDAISSSYRANQVDNFLAQASNYGVTHNPDERLDFIDNFDVFLKVKDDYLKAIKKWGSAGIQYLEDQLDALFLRSITQGERNALSQYGNFSSYRINLMLYLWNAYEATNVAESVMNSLPDPNKTIDGSVARNCGWCRGNAIKHAVWNIKNAHTFNKRLAQTLGTAHEDGQLGATRDMDLHNNAIGISLFESYEADGALSMLKDVLMNGMPGNSSNGFKFIIVNGSNPVLHWTKDYPNEN